MDADSLKDVKDFLKVQLELYGKYRPLSHPVSYSIEEINQDTDLEQTEISEKKENHDLLNFYHEIKECKACALGEVRTNFVFGVGNPDAELMFVGEAPGRDEDLQGKPFVGRAGQLLNLMLHAIGLKREDVFIANVLKCRPPKNRDPLPAEVQKCEPYLLKQIDLISPKLIVALGRIASASLLNTKASLGDLRNQIHTYNQFPLVVTYHPAALLRNPLLKRQAWDDLKKILTYLENK